MPSDWKPSLYSKATPTTFLAQLNQSITSSVINNISTIPVNNNHNTFLNTSLTATIQTINYPQSPKQTQPEHADTMMPSKQPAFRDTAAIHVIETKVQEIEAERRKLSIECDTLKSENRWYRKKLTEMETTLRATEEKHELLKRSHEEQQIALATLEKSLNECKKKEKKRHHKHEQKKQQIQQSTEEIVALKEKLERKETRVKALEIETDYLQKQLEEIRDKNFEQKIKKYETDLYNEKLEKEMIQERVKALEKEKEKLESEIFETRLRCEKGATDIDILKKREQESQNQVTGLITENTSLKDKISFLEQKLNKYKRSIKQQTATIEKLQSKQKDPLSFNAWVQTEESFPSFEHVRSRDETITALNSQLDDVEEKNRQLKSQLEYYIAQVETNSNFNDDLLRENQNLKNVLNDMNRCRAKDEQRLRMLERELEIKDAEIEKRNKFIRRMNDSSLHYASNELYD
ncbi:hypothetical protein FDP41_007392 [Naegleria fowleri]|uniref:Uncharacterized protein n=1 Tax=Naegleria fowleri TaxID=5763 RepID=A0A6A5CG29_NAEFO|nr:uncharacterized protein FDP41_007392 [Naegleria fowleri]KAF0984215.1 hypothetical protein FDP41_007392 [Naegleria fowleri]